MSVPPSSNKTEPAAKQRAGRPLRIILLDDVPEVRESIRAIIHAHWADAGIFECQNGNEAWKLVQESPPDLLISDLTHPGLGGEELSKRLAEAHPKLPVLVISAFQQGLDALRKKHQANPQAPRGFVAKPFTVEALQAEVGRLIAGRTTGR